MKKKIHFLPVGLLFLGGLVLGAFFDLKISGAMFYKNNVFGILLASIGELPMYGGVAFAGGMLFSSARKLTRSKALCLLSAVIAACMTVFGFFYQGKAFCSVNAWGSLYPVLSGNMAVAIPTGAVLVLPFLAFGYAVGQKGDAEDILRASLAILIVGVLQIALITVLKGVFHRPRFRILEESGAPFLPVFTRFKEYAGFITDTVTKEEFKAFPSGHTGSGAMLFVICACLPYITKKASMKKQPLYFYLGALYTAVLAFSRITVGAHYLTDVCFGALVTLVMFLLTDCAAGKLRQGNRSAENQSDRGAQVRNS